MSSGLTFDKRTFDCRVWMNGQARRIERSGSREYAVLSVQRQTSGRLGRKYSRIAYLHETRS